MSSPWFVPTTALRRTLGAQRQEHREGCLAGLCVAGNAVEDTAVIRADVVVTSVSGGVEVAGTVEAPWRGECRRCLQPVDGKIFSSVRELYRPVDGYRRDPDEDTYPLNLDHLDLEPLVRDAVLLELPLAPLCRPDCLGLCPLCGRDRNQSPCQCGAHVVDPRWAALAALLPDLPALLPDEPALLPEEPALLSEEPGKEAHRSVDAERLDFPGPGSDSGAVRREPNMHRSP